jgi:uncharacterized membrane protein
MAGFSNRFSPALGSQAGPALASGLLFLFVSSAFAIAQHLTFHTRARDMGIYIQILWNAAQGRPFASTLLQDNANHLAEHVAPALWPLVPLAGLAPGALPLIVLQQVFLAAGGLAVYLVALPLLGRGVALLVLGGFYLMPAMSRVSLSEFHPIVLAALPTASAAALALRGNPRSAALFLLLALLFEEETAPTVLGLGLMMAVRTRGRGDTGIRQAGPPHAVISPSPHPPISPFLAAASIAVLWLALVVLVVMPGFRLRPAGGRAEVANQTYTHFKQVSQEPAIVWRWLAVERGPDALSWLILPSGGLALLGPEMLAAAAPGFVVLFLQDRAGTYGGHWGAPLLPLVWLATAFGLSRVWRRPLLRWTGVALLIGGLALAYSQDSYFPGGREFEADHYQATALEADLRWAVERVPATASVAATRRVVPHLAARRDVYQFPFGQFYGPPLRPPDSQRLDYYILDLSDSPTRREVGPAESDSVLEKRPRYHVQRFGPEVLLLSRSRPEPSQRSRADSFGGTIGFLGLDWPKDYPVLRPRSGTLDIRLYWEALRRPGSDLNRALRLIDSDNKLVAELVGQPLDDYLPVRDWERGQVIAEDLVLLARMQPAMEYRLVVGWILPSGELLPLDGSGQFELQIAGFNWYN